MKFTVNYSLGPYQLINEGKVDTDVFKCPAFDINKDNPNIRKGLSFGF